jgi:hypothetical protein
MFYPKDNVIYDEAWDIVPAALVTKGQAAQLGDVLGFYYYSSKKIGDEVTFIYKQRQVDADKRTGTGEAIDPVSRLYYYPATDNVSVNRVGVAGVDYMFCGWSKKAAAASATRVLMNFDGTRYDQVA